MSHRDRRIDWLESDDVDYPWHATVDGKKWRVRLNDFPDAPHVYTLVIDDQPAEDLDVWPPAWRRTEVEPHAPCARSAPLGASDEEDPAQRREYEREIEWAERARQIRPYRAGAGAGLRRGLLLAGVGLEDLPAFAVTVLDALRIELHRSFELVRRTGSSGEPRSMSWSDGIHSLVAEQGYEPGGGLESGDWTCSARLEGLPDGCILSLAGEHVLCRFTVQSDDSSRLLDLELALMEAQGRLALGSGKWDVDPALPERWMERAGGLQKWLVAPEPRDELGWLVGTDGEGALAIAVEGAPTACPPRLECMGPISEVGLVVRSFELFSAQPQPPDQCLRTVFETVTGSALPLPELERDGWGVGGSWTTKRYRAGSWLACEWRQGSLRRTRVLREDGRGPACFLRWMHAVHGGEEVLGAVVGSGAADLVRSQLIGALPFHELARQPHAPVRPRP